MENQTHDFGFLAPSIVQKNTKEQKSSPNDYPFLNKAIIQLQKTWNLVHMESYGLLLWYF